MRERSACIVIDRQQQAVLLMRRVKAGREYSTLPGGKIEPGETPEAACVREVLEETGISVVLAAKVRVLFNLGRVEHYFYAASFGGQVALGGPEREYCCAENYYQPQWVPLTQLAQVNLLPVEVLQMIRGLL